MTTSNSGGRALNAAEAIVASLIIPLRASPALFQWQQRLSRILSVMPYDQFEVIVVDYGTGELGRRQLAAIVAAAPGPVRVIRVDCEGAPFSIGVARDTGVVAASAPVVLFNDVDFFAPKPVYEAVAAEIKARNLGQFADQWFCVPTIFLNSDGTEEYLAGMTAEDDVLHHKHFLHRAELDPSAVCVSISYGSSCIVANRHHYLSIGGHDESFWEHGAEDFELMHRLSALAPRAPRPPYYYVDFKDNEIANYRGFRAAFALYGVDAAQKDLFLVHLYHPRRPIKTYTRHWQNFRLLRRRMRRFDLTGRHPPPLPDAARGRTLLLVERSQLDVTALRYAFPLFGATTVKRAGEFSSSSQLVSYIRTNAIDRVITLNANARVGREPVAQASKGAGVRHLVFYRGALPNSWCFDERGSRSDGASYIRSHWDHPLSSAERQNIAGYIDGLFSAGWSFERAKPRIRPDILKSLLGIPPGTRTMLVAPAHVDMSSYTGAAAKPDGEFIAFLTQISPALRERGWLMLYPTTAAFDGTLPRGVVAVPEKVHSHDMIALSDQVLAAGSDLGLLAAALNKPVISLVDVFYGHSGIAARVASVDEILATINAPPHPDRETVDRFIFHLRQRLYSFGEIGPALGAGRVRDDGRTANEIMFDEIRGLGSAPLFFKRSDEMMSFGSSAFLPFGGTHALKRAWSLASLASAEGGQIQAEQKRNWSMLAFLAVYRSAVWWKLSRRERILLARAPEEYFRQSNSLFSRWIES